MLFPAIIYLSYFLLLSAASNFVLGVLRDIQVSDLVQQLRMSEKKGVPEWLDSGVKSCSLIEILLGCIKQN